MKKTEMIKAVQDKLDGFSLKDIECVVTALSEVIVDTVGADDELKLPGVGTFKAYLVSDRHVKNPRTGEMIDIPAHRVPKFKPAGAFKDALK